MSRVKLATLASILLLVAVSVSALVIHSAHAAATVSSFHFRFDSTGEQVVDGTGGQCVAETITITNGSVLIQGSSVQDASGDFLGTFDVAAHAIGTGNISGTQYELTGTTHDTFKLGPGRVFTEIASSRIVAPGPDNGLVFRSTNHLTITANGEVTAESGTFEITCQ